MFKKKHLFLGLTASLALLFGSCDKESYTHYVSITYPSEAARIVYADQPSDSVMFVTYDSYRYFAYSGNPDGFVSIDPKAEQQTIKNMVPYLFSLPVYFKQNTTDSCRVGYVGIRSYANDWESTVYAAYYQANWHCISKPGPQYHWDEKRTRIISCDHVLKDSAMQVTDTLQFYAYDNWTVKSQDLSIVEPEGHEEGKVSGAKSVDKKSIKVPLKMAPNHTSDTLRTTLTLTSDGGAKTIIEFEHHPAKKAQK